MSLKLRKVFSSAANLYISLSLPLVSYLFALGIPRSVPFIYAMLALLTIGGVRFGLRAIYLRSQIRHKPRVVIYGAGSAGRQLAASLTHGQEYLPIAFVDDALSLQNTYIEGLKVYPPRQLGYLADTYGAERVLLAVPSASRARRRATPNGASATSTSGATQSHPDGR